MAECNITMSLEWDGTLLSTAEILWLPMGTFPLTNLLTFSENIQGIIIRFIWFSCLNCQTLEYLLIFSFTLTPSATSGWCRDFNHRLTACVRCRGMYMSEFFPKSGEVAHRFRVWYLEISENGSDCKHILFCRKYITSTCWEKIPLQQQQAISSNQKQRVYVILNYTQSSSVLLLYQMCAIAPLLNMAESFL